MEETTKKPKLSKKEKQDLFRKEVIFKGYPRMELYKIIIDYIHGDYSSLDKIWSCNGFSLDDTLYKRKDGDEIPLGKPLKLCGPTRPPFSPDAIEIYFGVDEWHWVFCYDEGCYWGHPIGSGPVWDEVVGRNGSKARVFYELIARSVEADIEITFCYEDLGLQIQGEISATTKGNPDTKRVLVCLDDEGTSVKPDTPLSLDRAVVALPIKTVLHLSFDLTITKCGRKANLKKDDLLFEVPDREDKVSLEVPFNVSDLMQKKQCPSVDNVSGDFVIKIKVAWSNDMKCYFDEEELERFYRCMISDDDSD